jgi:hypothetical protein
MMHARRAIAARTRHGRKRAGGGDEWRQKGAARTSSSRREDQLRLLAHRLTDIDQPYTVSHNTISSFAE